MGLQDCRFDVSRTDTTLKLEARGRPLRGVGPAVRFGSLAMLVIWPATFAILSPRGDDTAPTFGFFLLAFIAAIANLLHATQTRLFATPVLGRVQASLIIETAPEDGHHRRAPGGPKVTIDGQVAERGDRPRVALSTTVLGKDQTASTHLMARYYVSLVLRQRLFRVETFKDLYAAFELTEKLAEALDADAGTIEPIAEVPVTGTFRGIATGLLGVLAQLVAAGAAIAWATTTDHIDGVSHALALAGVLTIAFALVAQEASFYFLIAAVADSARKIHGVAPGEARLRRRAWATTLLWIAAVIGMVGLAPLETPSPVTQGRFDPGGDRLVMFDVNGDGAPDPIGFMDGAEGKRLVALDARTGKPLWSREAQGCTLRFAPGGPPLLVGLSEASTTVSLESFDAKTGKPRWTVELADGLSTDVKPRSREKNPSELRGAALSGECLLVDASRFGRGFIVALDPATGMTCASMKWLEGTDAPVNEWPPLTGEEYIAWRAEGSDVTQLLARREMAHTRELALRPLEDDQKAREAESRVQSDEKRTVLADGFKYELRGTGRWPERLTLAVYRGDVHPWTTQLDATQIPELPFAVSGGDIVVVGVGLRSSQERLRLVGIDAKTGAIRYVRRHRSERIEPTCVVISGGVAIVAWAGDLLGYEAATGNLLWSTSSAEGAVRVPVSTGVAAGTPAPTAPDLTRQLNPQ